MLVVVQQKEAEAGHPDSPCDSVVDPTGKQKRSRSISESLPCHWHWAAVQDRSIVRVYEAWNSQDPGFSSTNILLSSMIPQMKMSS